MGIYEERRCRTGRSRLETAETHFHFMAHLIVILHPTRSVWFIFTRDGNNWKMPELM